MLLERETTTNPPVMPGSGGAKSWTALGNGNEALVRRGPKAVIQKEGSEEDKTTVATKHKPDQLDPGDLVFYCEKWLKVDSVVEGKVTVTEKDKTIELALADCVRAIPVQVLVYTPMHMDVYIMELNGKQEMTRLTKKVCKRAGAKAGKADWYYEGKIREKTDTVEKIGVKPGEKLACLLLGYETHTFKRFPQLDTSRGWYMSHSSPDAITFVPSREINLFGFGMYYTKEGPPTYTLEYEVKINDQTLKQDTLPVTKPGPEAEIMQVFLDPNQTPTKVASGDKIAVIVKYPNYDEGSKLIVGTAGEGYDTIEGNEPGLFKVEECGSSGNGTDINAGQIPELYYSHD